MTKILIVDDHPLYREGVISALSGRPLRAVVVGVSPASDAINLLDNDPTFELALVDRKLRSEDGLDALKQIGLKHPTVARLLISGEDSAELMAEAMRAGAQGFLPKSLSIGEMLAAIGRVLDGDVYWPVREPPHVAIEASRMQMAPDTPASPTLTARQSEVLRRLAEGKSNAEIAVARCISERTVKAHLKGAFDSLGVDSRVKALIKARELGMIG